MKRLFTDDYSELTEEDIAYLKSELMDFDELPENEITDDDIYNRFMDDLEYECQDLHDILEKIDEEFITNDLIAIADLGLWNGRFSGHKELKSLPDISTCMYDYNTIYVDRLDLKVRATHHDGTNYYTIREYKDISDEQRENFLDKIYYGKATRKDITRYTRAIGKTVFDNFYL